VQQAVDRVQEVPTLQKESKDPVKKPGWCGFKGHHNLHMGPRERGKGRDRYFRPNEEKDLGMWGGDGGGEGRRFHENSVEGGDKQCPSHVEKRA